MGEEGWCEKKEGYRLRGEKKSKKGLEKERENIQKRIIRRGRREGQAGNGQERRKKNSLPKEEKKKKKKEQTRWC